MQDQGRNQPSAGATVSSSSSTNSFRDSFENLKNDSDQLYPLLTLIGLTVTLVVVYWNSLNFTVRAWYGAQYSHGWLIPLFVLVLLWMRWQPFQPVPTKERWWGVGLLTVGLLARLQAASYLSPTLDSPTLVISLLGVFLLVGGIHMIRWSWPAICFLIFMYPLPTQIQVDVLGWLQKVATVASTFVIQTIGIMAVREGNVISIMTSVGEGNTTSIDTLHMNVVDACSGLRMTTIFIALAVAIVMITKRPWWDRLIILLSSVPIALIVNVIRITVTAILLMLAGDKEWVQMFSHDAAGWFMMPLALGLLYLEIQILDWLVIEDEPPRVGPMRTPGRPAPVGKPAPAVS